MLEKLKWSEVLNYQISRDNVTYIGRVVTFPRVQPRLTSAVEFHLYVREIRYIWCASSFVATLHWRTTWTAKMHDTPILRQRFEFFISSHHSRFHVWFGARYEIFQSLLLRKEYFTFFKVFRSTHVALNEKKFMVNSRKRNESRVFFLNF